MNFILQLDLRRPIPICKRFAFAYLFTCPHYENYRAGPRGEPCPTWDAFVGANDLILQTSLSGTTARIPHGSSPWPERAIDFVPYEADDSQHEDGESGLINPKFMELLRAAEANTPPDSVNVEVVFPEHWEAPRTI